MKKQVFSYLKKKVMETTDKQKRSKHADNIIRNHVIWSMGAGLIPILIADIFAISALQLDMIRQLSKAYGVDFQETKGKAVVTALTSSTLARVGAGSLAKLIPVIGTYLGGVTVSVFAGASTYALGEVFKKHFETGGTILDFDPASLKKAYKEKFEKGKKVVMDWEKEVKQSGPTAPDKDAPTAPTTTPSHTPNDEILDKLKDLADLKEKGILTDEEFQAMKKKLLEKF